VRGEQCASLNTYNSKYVEWTAERLSDYSIEPKAYSLLAARLILSLLRLHVCEHGVKGSGLLAEVGDYCHRAADGLAHEAL
jgi:hypothetical protein